MTLLLDCEGSTRKLRDREDALASTRDACAPQSEIERSSFREAFAARLYLITQTLLVPMRPHALAALVLGNFRFPSFLK
jgi:hypothetical protein